MRFRTFGNMPSFGGYLSGHSFWKTAAYAVASDMGRAIDSPKQIRASIDRFEEQLNIKIE